MLPENVSKKLQDYMQQMAQESQDSGESQDLPNAPTTPDTAGDHRDYKNHYRGNHYRERNSEQHSYDRDYNNYNNYSYNNNNYNNDWDWYEDQSHYVVSIFAYLIGVHEKVFRTPRPPLLHEIYDALELQPRARTIRHLCILRTELERNFRYIANAMTQDQRGLEDLGEYISINSIQQLRKDGIEIISTQYNHPLDYVFDINELIEWRINKCADLFPQWVDWPIIEDMFIMPNGTQREGTQLAATTYYRNRRCYPYRMYINWQPTDCGNLLYSDRKFLLCVYKLRDKKFTAFDELDALVDQELDENTVYDFSPRSGQEDEPDLSTDTPSAQPESDQSDLSTESVPEPVSEPELVPQDTKDKPENAEPVEPVEPIEPVKPEIPDAAPETPIAESEPAPETEKSVEPANLQIDEPDAQVGQLDQPVSEPVDTAPESEPSAAPEPALDATPERPAEPEPEPVQADTQAEQVNKPDAVPEDKSDVAPEAAPVSEPVDTAVESEPPVVIPESETILDDTTERPAEPEPEPVQVVTQDDAQTEQLDKPEDESDAAPEATPEPEAPAAIPASELPTAPETTLDAEPAPEPVQAEAQNLDAQAEQLDTPEAESDATPEAVPASEPEDAPIEDKSIEDKSIEDKSIDESDAAPEPEAAAAVPASEPVSNPAPTPETSTVLETEKLSAETAPGPASEAPIAAPEKARETLESADQSASQSGVEAGIDQAPHMAILDGVNRRPRPEESAEAIPKMLIFKIDETVGKVGKIGLPSAIVAEGQNDTLIYSYQSVENQLFVDEALDDPEIASDPDKTPENTAETAPEPEKAVEPEAAPEPEKTAEPETAPEPTPESEKAVEPEAAPAPEKAPENTVEAAPEAVPEPVSAPEKAAESEPVPEPTTEPNKASENTVEAVPEPVPEPEKAAKPQPTPEPEKAAKPTPAPKKAPDAKPASKPAPEPAPAASPKPAAAQATKAASSADGSEDRVVVIRQTSDVILKIATKFNIFIDCQSADPYRVHAFLDNIEPDQAARLSTILLLEDPETKKHWQKFEQAISYPVEWLAGPQNESERTLTDMTTTARICQEVYQKKIDGLFVISGRPEHFMFQKMLSDVIVVVLIDRSAINYEPKLRVQGIVYDHIENCHSAHSETLRKNQLAQEMHNYIDSKLHFNVRTMFSLAVANSHVRLTNDENKKLYQEMIDALRIVVDKEGNLGLRLDY